MMEVRVSEMNRVDLVEVTGRVDSSTARQLGEHLETQMNRGRNRIVVDLSAVDYISSAGLRELVSGLKRAKQDGGDLRLARPSDRVREVLEMAGLSAIFEIFESQVEAVGSF